MPAFSKRLEFEARNQFFVFKAWRCQFRKSKICTCPVRNMLHMRESWIHLMHVTSCPSRTAGDGHCGGAGGPGPITWKAHDGGVRSWRGAIGNPQCLGPRKRKEKQIEERSEGLKRRRDSRYPHEDLHHLRYKLVVFSCR